MKIYTRTGDDGTSGLLDNKRVRKDDIRLEAYGEVDELNAALGVVLSQSSDWPASAASLISGIQSNLFTIGTVLATPPQTGKTLARLDPAETKRLENAIDQMEEELPPLKNFILPQGSGACSFTHLARAICRRAERRVVALSGLEPVDPVVLVYLNRLSDYLFVLARWINRREGGTETIWTAEGPVVQDRLESTLQKLEDDKRKRQTLFEKAAQDLQKKKERAEKIFRQNVDSINKEGGKVEKPLRDMDLD